MPQQIRKSVAQQIVETVKDVSGRDVNFIDKNGVIFASTDSVRVGDFHEIGFQVIKTGDSIEVDTDDTFLGTHRGVNLPFTYRGEIIAAIGITGPPEEVRKYAYLAQRITALILREQELDERDGNERAQLNYIIRALITGDRVNMDFLVENLAKYHLTPDCLCRTVIIRREGQRETINLSQVESEIKGALEQTGSRFYTFLYPRDYIFIVESKRYDRWKHVFWRLAAKNRGILRIGVGDADALMDQNKSFEAAKIALSSLSGDRNLAVFDDLDLDILLGSIPDGVRRRYLEKTALALTAADRKLLTIYFQENMSLKAVGEILFMHKNTIQYQLDRIARKTGRNPRFFPDGVILYLALKLTDNQSAACII